MPAHLLTAGKGGPWGGRLRDKEVGRPLAHIDPDPVPPSCTTHVSCRSALILYRQILDAIEVNDYDNFTMRAYVPKWRKFASLPQALGRAVMPRAKA